MIFSLICNNCFFIELFFIRCCSIKFTSTWCILIRAENGFFNCYFILHKAFSILCFIIEFIGICLISIMRTKLILLTFHWTIINLISRFQQLRIVATLIEFIHTFLWFLNSDIVLLVIMMICRFSFECDVSLRAMMMAWFKWSIPQVHI